MSRTINRNESVIFSVKVMGDSTSITYQWQKDDVDLTETTGKIEGVNTAILTIITAQNSDEGTYRCVISDGRENNIVVSNEATLTVGKV